MQRVLSFPQSAHFSQSNRAGEFVTKRLCFSCLCSIAFLALLSGFFLGRFVTYRYLEIRASKCKADVAYRSKSHINAAEYLEKRIHRQHINDYHQALMDLSNKTGSEGWNFEQAKKLLKHFNDYGFSSVSSLSPSQVLLTYHDQLNPTLVELRSDMQLLHRQFLANATSRFNLPVNASVSALKRTLQAPPLFVNFGSKQDYDYLESRNIRIRNHIFIIKVKRLFIFKQVSEALRRGALGVLLCSDSPQFSETKNRKGGFGLSPTMLGRLQLQFGDPFTQQLGNVSKESESSIMVDILDNEESENLFNLLSINASAFRNWRGFLNTSHHSSVISNSRWQITMISTTLNVLHTYYNVIGALQGAEEPDRYVLLGSNRMSFTESDDQLGGTAAMMEIARVFGELNRVRGWVPRRTVVFCSWGLQGDGHFNSESWAQLLHPLLTERAVAYLSVEVAVKGNSTLRIQSAPLLMQVVEDASLLVPTPDPVEKASHRYTLGDTIHHIAAEHNKSVIDTIHGEGDFQMFLFEQGIPSIDFGYDGEERFTDPTFSFHRAITELWAILIWNLADNPVLPLNPLGYSKFLLKSFSALQKAYATIIEKHFELFNVLQETIIRFNSTVNAFQTKLHYIDKTDCLGMRVVNDQLVRLEKQMLCFPEMQNQGAHPLLSEGSLYSVGFGTLQDLLEDSLMWPDSSSIVEQIEKELRMLVECIRNGELILKNVVVTLTQT